MSFATGFVGAATPGIVQGINDYRNRPSPISGASDAATLAGQASEAAWQPGMVTPELAAQGMGAAPPPVPFSVDANGMAVPMAAPGVAALNSFATASPIQSMAAGGPVRAAGGGAIPTIYANSGSRAVRPELMRGPAGPGIPMGQGITPASDDGQILTMEQGGTVPFQNDTQQARTLQPAVSGGAAGFTSGLASGQVMGSNIVNAWHNHQAREAAQSAGQDAVGIESATTGVDAPPAEQFDNTVTRFMHHLHGALFNDDPNPQPNQGPYPLHPTAGVNPVPGGPPSPYMRPGTPGIPANPDVALPGSAAASAPAPSPVPTPTGGPPTAPAPPAPFVPPAAAPNAAPGAQPQTAQASATATAGTKPDIATQGVAGAQDYKETGKVAPVPESVGITPEWWEHSEQLKMHAMQNAWKMGKDPAQVGASMDAIRTGAMQSQAARFLSTANEALSNDDQPGVIQAMKNMYHFIPNGKDLDIKTASQADIDKNNALAPDPNAAPGSLAAQAKPGYDPTLTKAGTVMYRDPFYGMPGYESTPQFRAVTKQHLGDLFQNIMDPQNASKNLYAQYGATVKARTELADSQSKAVTAQGALARGEGILGQGTAAQQKQALAAIMQPHQARLDDARADQAESEAKKADRWVQLQKNGPSVTMGAVNTASAAALKAAQDAAQGPLETAPLMVPQGTNQGKPTGAKGPDGQLLMETNLSPGAGKPTRNPAKIDPAWQGLTTEQQTAAASKAQSIAIANLGKVGSAEAQDSAARITRIQANPSAFTHKDEKGVETLDYVPDPEHGAEYLWVRTPKANGMGYRGGQWRKYSVVTPNVSDSEPAPSAAGSGGGSSQSEAEPAMVDATDN